MLISILLIILIFLGIIKYCEAHEAENASNKEVTILMLIVVLGFMALSSWCTMAYYTYQAGVFQWLL